MGQKYFINSQELEDKIRQLLPSQGGAGAGVDLSASTQIVPIIDLTESAEGSNVRADLQSALSLSTATAFAIDNANTNIITNTGYFRIIASFRLTGAGSGSIEITDGATTTSLVQLASASGFALCETIDVVVFVQAGESVSINSSASTIDVRGSVRQIADIDGNLTNP